MQLPPISQEEGHSHMAHSSEQGRDEVSRSTTLKGHAECPGSAGHPHLCWGDEVCSPDPDSSGTDRPRLRMVPAGPVPSRSLVVSPVATAWRHRLPKHSRSGFSL